MTLRKTANNIYCIGELISTEFIEETSSYDGKEYRKLNATVRYAPNMELQFTMKYNKQNAKGEESSMYPFVSEVFNKYKASVQKVLIGRESDGKPIWDEITNPKGEKVVCKAELVPIERAYLNKQSNNVELATNNMLKLNGKYGITHAKEDDTERANFTLEMYIKELVEQTINENIVMFIKGFGISQIGSNFSVYPITLKVPGNGAEKIKEQFDDFDFKDGITATFKGNILKGKEMIQIDTDLEGNAVLSERNLNEFRVNVLAKNILEYDEDNPKLSISPDEIKELNKERVKRNDEKIEKKKQELNMGETTISDDDLPF